MLSLLVDFLREIIILDILISSKKVSVLRYLLDQDTRGRTVRTKGVRMLEKIRRRSAPNVYIKYNVHKRRYTWANRLFICKYILSFEFGANPCLYGRCEQYSRFLINASVNR